MEFNENPSSGRRVVVACGRTDITKPIVTSRNFSNSPKNALYYKNDTEYPNSPCGQHADLQFLRLVVYIITQLECIFILQGKKHDFKQPTFFYRCTVHSDICKVHSPNNALLLI